MKCCGFILAFYLVLLSAVPCCVDDDCTKDNTEMAASHKNGDKGCGNCSPFFNCEGCATACIVLVPAFAENRAELSGPVFPPSVQRKLPDVDYDFWQPPKLS